MVEANHPKLSVARQCELLDLARSSFYYESVRGTSEDLLLKRLLDEEYTRHPFYGVRRMTHWLGEQGYVVNVKRVRRLLREMGLVAIYPKPRVSLSSAEHRIYPYLLRGVRIKRVNQVWSADITYIRLWAGFVYLTAILDWYSRYVLAWQLSTTLESAFCVQALETAMEQYGCPEVFNTDQGSQFTSRDFTDVLESREARISMDGRGRVFDNIFVERLWRTVKYEEVYLKDYQTVSEARAGLAAFFTFYNGERLHQALQYSTPAAIYFGESLY